MQFTTPINTDQYQDLNQRKLVPAGTYLAQITGEELVENSKKNGHHVDFTFRIMGGEEDGSELYVTLNLFHTTSQGAVEIANREISTIHRACGGSGIVQDSSVLFGIPMEIDVIEEPSNDPKYGPSNEVKMYRRASTAGGTAADPQAPRPAAPTAPIGGSAGFPPFAPGTAAPAFPDVPPLTAPVAPAAVQAPAVAAGPAVVAPVAQPAAVAPTVTAPATVAPTPPAAGGAPW